ncbi:hypothetical protein M422DRAFT_65854, partial [Sphaerobolus stellatus SS14]
MTNSIGSSPSIVSNAIPEIATSFSDHHGNLNDYDPNDIPALSLALESQQILQKRQHLQVRKIRCGPHHEDIWVQLAANPALAAGVHHFDITWTHGNIDDLTEQLPKGGNTSAPPAVTYMPVNGYIPNSELVEEYAPLSLYNAIRQMSNLRRFVFYGDHTKDVVGKIFNSISKSCPFLEDLAFSFNDPMSLTLGLEGTKCRELKCTHKLSLPVARVHELTALALYLYSHSRCSVCNSPEFYEKLIGRNIRDDEEVPRLNLRSPLPTQRLDFKLRDLALKFLDLNEGPGEHFPARLFKYAHWPLLRRLTIYLGHKMTSGPLFEELIIQDFLRKHPTLEALCIDDVDVEYIPGLFPTNGTDMSETFLPNLRALKLPSFMLNDPSILPVHLTRRLEYFSMIKMGQIIAEGGIWQLRDDTVKGKIREVDMAETLAGLKACELEVSLLDKKFNVILEKLPSVEKLDFVKKTSLVDRSKPFTRKQLISFVKKLSKSHLQSQLTHLGGLLTWETVEIPKRDNNLIKQVANMIPSLQYIETCQEVDEEHPYGRRVWIELQRNRSGLFRDYVKVDLNDDVYDEDWGMFFKGFRNSTRRISR